MNNLKISVIDGIMGSGKSTGMINRIKYIKKQNPDENFLIILPYLDEIKRYKEKLKNFYPLIEDNPPKRLSLEKYLKEKKDIICTHQLFLQNSDLIVTYAKDYNLVIDESLNSLISVAEFPQLIGTNNLNSNIGIDGDKKLYLKDTAQKYTFTNTDIDYLINYSYLKYSSTQDNLIVWGDKIIEEASILNCIKNYFIQNDVYRLESKHEIEDNNYYYISLFPIKTFQVFKSICIMTYLWNAQLMKYYFDFYNATYTYLYPIPCHPITRNQESLESINFKEFDLNKNYTKLAHEDRDFIISNEKRIYLNFEKLVKFKTCENINIPGYKLKENTKTIIKDTKSRTSLYTFWDKNKKAKGTITLSYSYYNKYLDEKNNNEILEILKKNINKFCKDNIPQEINKNKKIIWTVFDCAKNKLKSASYISEKNYIPINSKATNEYRDANVLIYLVNRYINPHLYNFITNYCHTGSEFSENLYALSELIQWIWRSAIRDNKPICIYIASERMLNILLDWLNNTLTDTYSNLYENVTIEENNILTNTSANSNQDIANQDTNFKDKHYSDFSNENIIEQEDNINFTNKNIENTTNSTKNLVSTESKPTDTQTASFSNLAKKLKNDKIMAKCIKEIGKYINDTIYETNEVFYFLEEKLENLNDKYSYELILYTIEAQAPDLMLAKFGATHKSLSEEDYINSLFKIIQENIDNYKKHFDFDKQFLK